jgi:hypothetical protein
MTTNRKSLKAAFCTRTYRNTPLKLPLAAISSPPGSDDQLTHMES